jgi:hypothetical protein
MGGTLSTNAWRMKNELENVPTQLPAERLPVVLEAYIS